MIACTECGAEQHALVARIRSFGRNEFFCEKCRDWRNFEWRSGEDEFEYDLWAWDF